MVNRGSFVSRSIVVESTKNGLFVDVVWKQLDFEIVWVSLGASFADIMFTSSPENFLLTPRRANVVGFKKRYENVAPLLLCSFAKAGFSAVVLDAARGLIVLTFYRAQQLKLRERLSGWTSGPSPEVSSVDGYQGKENEVIVLSAVRSRNSLGFCGDPRRVNVVLTRAKRGLIVVGKRGTLQTSPLWTRWLMEAE